MIFGIDVSNHQQEIDWVSVTDEEVKFALVKASEGTDFVDAYFARNWSEMRKYGIARGAYHYAQVGNAPEQDADHFLSVVTEQGLVAGDVVALDLEEGDGDLSGWALRWLQHVEAAVGCKPLLYSYPHFMAVHALRGPLLAEYGLWYASWRAQMPAPPPDWSVIAVWQNSRDGTVSGVTGPCDTNWFNGESIEQFRAYGVPADPNAPGWVIGAGVAAVMADARDEARSNEEYLQPAGEYSLTSGRDALYVYSKAADRVARIRWWED